MSDPNKSPLYVILFAALVSGAFTAAIMALHVATQPVVKANQRLLTEKALVDLFNLGDPNKMTGPQIGDTVRRRIAGYHAEGDTPGDLRRSKITITDPHTHTDIEILVAFRYDLPADQPPDIHDRANIVGYAFPISGVGFWARIDGLLAVQADAKTVLGIVFLHHSETPGLGGRITEPEFRDQFRPRLLSDGTEYWLTIAPPPSGENTVTIGGPAPAQTDPAFHRHVDAITGATGTSTAVGKFLNADIAVFRRAAAAAGLTETSSQPAAGPAPQTTGHAHDAGGSD